MGVGSEARGEERVDLSEILKEKLYFAPLQRVEDTSAVVQCLPKRTVSFNIDLELVCLFPFIQVFLVSSDSPSVGSQSVVVRQLRPEHACAGL